MQGISAQLFHCFGDGRLVGPHGRNGIAQQLVQIPAQHFRALTDHIAGTAGGEFLVLELFLQAGKLHIRHAVAGTHPRRRADQARQLVGGKKHLFHFQLRLHVHAQPVAVAHHRVNESVLRADLPQKLRRFHAVLLRVAFKIHIVQKADQPPEILFFPIAQFPGIVAHHAFHRQRVLNMKGLLVVFGQQGVSLLPGDLRFHSGSLAFIGLDLSYCSSIRAKVQTADGLTHA